MSRFNDREEFVNEALPAWLHLLSSVFVPLGIISAGFVALTLRAAHHSR